jgi:PAS domain S-box-containing protein
MSRTRRRPRAPVLPKAATGIQGRDELTPTYQHLLETVRTGVAAVSDAGIIVSGDDGLAELLGQPVTRLLGTPLRAHLRAADGPVIDELLGQARTAPVRGTIHLTPDAKHPAPVHVSISRLERAGDEAALSVVLRDLTPLRQRHDRVVASERLARSILDQVADAIVVCDAQGRVIRLSRAAERLAGGPPLSQPFVDAFPLQTRRTDTFDLGRVLQGEAIRNVDAVLDRPGQRLDVILNAGPLRSGRRIIGAVITLTDVTWRKRVEEALVEREKQYRDLVETAHDLIWAVDAEGRITFVNQAAARIYGYAPNELLGRNFLELLPPDRRAAQAEQFANMLAAGDTRVVGVETDVLHRDGRRRSLLANAVVKYDPRGQPVGIVGTSTDVTDRKRAEAELRLQSAALNAAANPMIITDRHGVIEWVNPAFTTMTGFTAAEALGRTPWALLDSSQQDSFNPALWEAIRSGRVWEDELVNRRKDGTRYTEARAITPVTDERGEISHFVAIKQDVTARKRTEAELGERARLAALRASVGLALTGGNSLRDALQQCAAAIVTHLDAAFVRIWTLDDRAGVLELQASAGIDTQLDGGHRTVPLGQFKIGRIALRRQPHLTNDVIGDSEGHDHDQEWARREGMVAFAGHPLIVDDRVVGVLAVFARHPLSDSVIDQLGSVATHIALGIDHRRSGEALRIAEQRMRFALESANVGIWDHDYATGRLAWSELLEQQHGLEPGTFGGTFEAFVERVHPDDRAAVLDTIGQGAATDRDFTVTYRAVWPDGPVRWMRGAGRIHLDEAGHRLRAVGICQDVTERHVLEQQYFQAQKMEAVGRLAGGVAHDFNNLLTAILGYCDLLLTDLDPSDPRRLDLTEIQTAGHAAARLTRQLLAFSRKQIMDPALLDLNSVVASVRSMLDRVIGEDVTVVLGLGAEPARIRADRGQVEQVILNLAVNARDAMPDGGTLTIDTATVEIDDEYARTQLSPEPGSYVVLTVTDTGVGMAPDVLAHLFEPFFTTKEPGKGTGLGLATVHGIVSQSGGAVHVYSEVGCGTAFKVYFPRADEPEPAAAPTPAARPATGVETVLVVEDAEGLRELTRRLLERQGYRTLVAADADEARRLFAGNETIDVLLTDVVMPETSGPELAAELVRQRPSLRIIYMSGYTEDAIVQHGILDRTVAFLHKPFTAAALAQKIREILDK